MGETRVNLKHLLEDIRDSYPFPQEEAIITELIANSLDSSASEIDFFVDASQRTFTVVDNGKGMSEKDFEEYHDIAATKKVRGKGIGFAGVGVKLSLLLSDNVVTETKNRDNHRSTKWQLQGSQRAPWQFVEPQHLIKSHSGTAVTLFLPDKSSDLLNPSFVSNVIQTHFYPLLHQDFMDKILRHVYKKGVLFRINNAPVALPDRKDAQASNLFLVQVGKKGNPVGVGILTKSKQELPEDERGIAISTYGKVIKRGWDWIGITPRNPTRVTGIVEIPQLSEILTLNKADFLKDATSLQKYYRYRKAAQEAIEPILRELGEISIHREEIERDLQPLQKQIEEVLTNLLPEFPELSPLLGRRGKGSPVSGILPDPEAPDIGRIVQGVDVMTGTRGGRTEGKGIEAAPGQIPGERVEPSSDPTEPGVPHEGHRKRPGLMLGFDDDPTRQELGWLMDTTIWINKAHSAYRKAEDSEFENYHIVISVAWVLSGFLDAEKSPLAFLNRFLAAWGKQ